MYYYLTDYMKSPTSKKATCNHQSLSATAIRDNTWLSSSGVKHSSSSLPLIAVMCKCVFAWCYCNKCCVRMPESYKLTRTATSLSLSLCRRNRDLEEHHTTEPGSLWNLFSCSSTDDSLAGQQSDRAGHQLGSHVGLPVCGADMDTTHPSCQWEHSHPHMLCSHCP